MEHDNQGEFERLMGSAFSADEQLDLDLAALAPNVFQPILPSREELLSYFDELLEIIGVMTEEMERQAHIDRFLNDLTSVFNIDIGTPVKVKQVSSLMTRAYTGKVQWAMTTPDTDLLGDFAGMIVAPWYDIPYGIKPADKAPYARRDGLIMAFTNARLACEDIPVAAVDNDCALVPLNYGKPELYRILPPTA